MIFMGIKFVEHEPIDFEKVDYKSKILDEINNGRELNALFFIHSYIEGYLTQLIFVTGDKEMPKISRDMQDSIDRIGFNDLLHVNAMLGNINEKLFAKLKIFNKSRNELVHKIITIDVQSEKTRKKFKRIVIDALEACNNLFEIYKKEIERKGEQK